MARLDQRCVLCALSRCWSFVLAVLVVVVVVVVCLFVCLFVCFFLFLLFFQCYTSVLSVPE